MKSLFQRILVAYHTSDSSKKALMYGIIMAKLYKCQLKVISVVDTATIKYLTLSKFMVADEAEALKKNLEHDAEKNFEYAASLAKSKGVKIETEIRYGALWSEIIAVSKDFKCNLILLGGEISPSHSSFSPNAVSKQHKEILDSVDCNVMIVKEPHIEQLFKLV